jgi:hypothetical protein
MSLQDRHEQSLASLTRHDADQKNCVQQCECDGCFMGQALPFWNCWEPLRSVTHLNDKSRDRPTQDQPQTFLEDA